MKNIYILFRCEEHNCYPAAGYVRLCKHSNVEKHRGRNLGVAGEVT